MSSRTRCHIVSWPWHTWRRDCLVFVYCKHGGLIPNASTLFREVVASCFRLHDETLKTLEMGSRLLTSRRLSGSTPWLETTLSIMEMFTEGGDVDNAESLFDELSQVKHARYTFVVNALIRAYVPEEDDTGREEARCGDV
ncbi:hypothetical protein MLD38_013391 [Melastoma candidum]|uniref:Uncharacterized protein n=1 Tax=Melastoma candidum TaxID=119954 RepID=A0ACB9RAK7_9MYRT|nr:hypothetical protein MLD38_013391 [Melastoma candidum]